MNAILTLYIIKQENTRPKYHQWFTAHKIFMCIFVILSSADIKALSILHSNLAGFTFFRAPFSDTTKSNIFWGSCLNIFIKDIPQVITQVRI